jgi:hypothetical protein
MPVVLHPVGPNGAAVHSAFWQSITSLGVRTDVGISFGNVYDADTGQPLITPPAPVGSAMLSRAAGSAPPLPANLPSAALLAAARPATEQPVAAKGMPAELRLVGSWSGHDRQLEAVRAAAERFGGPVVAVGGHGRLAEVLRELSSYAEAGGVHPVVVQTAGAPLDGALAGLRVTRVRHVPRGRSLTELLDGVWEVVDPDGSVRSFGAKLTGEVADAARVVAARVPVDVHRLKVSTLLAEWSDVSGWAAAGEFFRAYRAELMAPDVVSAVAGDGVRAIALKVEQGGRPLVAVKPRAKKVWDREEVPQGPLGGDFVFDYLAAPKGTERSLWDGLLFSVMVAGKVPLELGLRLVDALGDVDHAATNGRVFHAVALVLEHGEGNWEQAKSLVTWKNCKLPPDDKWAWFQRLDNVMGLTPGNPENAALLDNLANVLANCL